MCMMKNVSVSSSVSPHQPKPLLCVPAPLRTQCDTSREKLLQLSLSLLLSNFLVISSSFTCCCRLFIVSSSLKNKILLNSHIKRREKTILLMERSWMWTFGKFVNIYKTIDNVRDREEQEKYKKVEWNGIGKNTDKYLGVLSREFTRIHWQISDKEKLKLRKNCV